MARRRTQSELEHWYDAMRARASNPELCYDAVSGTLVGDPSDPLNGVAVQLIGIDAATGRALVRHPSLPNQEAYFPLCADDDPWLTTPTGTDLPPTCCVDERTGLVTCPQGAADSYMHGRTVPLETITCYTDDTAEQNRWCEVHTGDNEFLFLSCPQPPDLIPPPGTPQQCCYDVASGTLRCDGEWNGLKVSLLAMQPQADGSILAIVMSPDFAPENSTMAFPICDDPVVDCCYDPTTETIVCPGNELDGAAAGIVASWVSADGQIYVWAVWQGGGARMPLCPGTDECPPVFCCVNLQTLTLVCPGKPELNGTPAEVTDFVMEDGYTWGVYADGTRIPTCGQRCPPPQLCPDCPTCPPGQFLSPDGTCHEPPECPPELDPCPPGMWRDPNGACVPPPTCPKCPPGTLLDTSTMQCVQCNCPPKEPCCDDCAHGHPCSGCDEGRRGASGGALRVRHAGPMRNPDLRNRYQSARKRKLFSGNR